MTATPITHRRAAPALLALVLLLAPLGVPAQENNPWEMDPAMWAGSFTGSFTSDESHEEELGGFEAVISYQGEEFPERRENPWRKPKPERVLVYHLDLTIGSPSGSMWKHDGFWPLRVEMTKVSGNRGVYAASLITHRESPGGELPIPVRFFAYTLFRPAIKPATTFPPLAQIPPQFRSYRDKGRQGGPDYFMENRTEVEGYFPSGVGEGTDPNVFVASSVNTASRRDFGPLAYEMTFLGETRVNLETGMLIDVTATAKIAMRAFGEKGLFLEITMGRQE